MDARNATPTRSSRTSGDSHLEAVTLMSPSRRLRRMRPVRIRFDGHTYTVTPAALDAMTVDSSFVALLGREQATIFVSRHRLEMRDAMTRFLTALNQQLEQRARTRRPRKVNHA